jgi:tRNA(adenine34) deaminase
MAEPARYQGLLLMNSWLATGDEPLTPGFLAWRGDVPQKPRAGGRLLARAVPAWRGRSRWPTTPFPGPGHRAAAGLPPCCPSIPMRRVRPVAQARAFGSSSGRGAA